MNLKHTIQMYIVLLAILALGVYVSRVSASDEYSPELLKAEEFCLKMEFDGVEYTNGNIAVCYLTKSVDMTDPDVKPLYEYE